MVARNVKALTLFFNFSMPIMNINAIVIMNGLRILLVQSLNLLIHYSSLSDSSDTFVFMASMDFFFLVASVFFANRARFFSLILS